MSIAVNIIAHALIREAISSASGRVRSNWRVRAEEEVVEYYMTFVVGPIKDKDEQTWILYNKIAPVITKMTDNQLGKLLKLRDKNNKLVVKNKPIKLAPVTNDDLVKFHHEYRAFLQEEKKRMADEARVRAAAAKRTSERRKYILENGESDAELAAKFF